MSQNNESLNPCPLCANRAKLIPLEQGLSAWVECVNCGCNVHSLTDEGAVANWNTRPNRGEIRDAEAVDKAVAHLASLGDSKTDWMWCHENPKEAAALIDRLNSYLATREPVSVKDCTKAVASVFVPDGVYNIEEGWKMEKAAKAVLEAAGVKYHD